MSMLPTPMIHSSWEVRLLASNMEVIGGHNNRLSHYMEVNPYKATLSPIRRSLMNSIPWCCIRLHQSGWHSLLRQLDSSICGTTKSWKMLKAYLNFMTRLDIAFEDTTNMNHTPWNGNLWIRSIQNPIVGWVNKCWPAVLGLWPMPQVLSFVMVHIWAHSSGLDISEGQIWWSHVKSSASTLAPT